MNVTSQKALIAMSGGVDSSVAAWLMKKSGYECRGAMMKLFANPDLGLDTDRACCSQEDAEDARAVAEGLGLPFHVLNFTGIFAEQVINRFAAAYQKGWTPNPCIDCNRFVKFEHLLHRARQFDCQCLATGHYARIEEENGRYILKKGADESKDQSYVLYALTQEQLAGTRFPLGGLTKAEVRALAEELGFGNAKKRDSQDICFAPDGDYAAFIERRAGKVFEKGFIIDRQGRCLGEHQGLIHYTVGQRRGLGLPGGPWYVREVRAETNAVVIGPEEDLYAKALTARDINLIPLDRLEGPIRVGAKIRYRQTEQPATLWQLDDDVLRVEFDQPQRAITKGQAVVLYDGEVVIGGGTIANPD